MAMLSSALHLLSLLIPPAVVGALAGLLAARRFLSHQLKRSETVIPEPDQFTSAALDEAAVRYATARGRPETAGVISAKLHLLHRLGMRRRWQP